MNCKNCGREFEGKFCPECGTQVEEELAQCPNCGAERVDNGKFCVNCGYNFEDPAQSAKIKERKPSRSDNGGVNKFLNVFVKVYRWLIAGGMLFVGIVSLLCLTAPTLVEDFLGETNPLCTGFVAIGNGSEVDVTPTVVNASVTLLVVSLLAIVYGGVQLYLAFKRPYSNTVGKKKFIFWGIDGVFALMLIILGGVVAGEANSEELMDAKLGSGFAMCIVMGALGLVFLGARIFYELKVFKLPNNSTTPIFKYNEKDFQWKITNENTLSLVKYSGTSKHVGVPSIINGYNVVSIDDYAFSGCSKLIEIQIPSTVTEIGKYAFHGCISLKSLVLPNSVTNIGDYAFYHCGSLESVKISNSVKSIGDFAFSGCSKLRDIQMPSSITEIGKYTFYNCSSLTSLALPSNVTSIGDRAFEFCTRLAQINIPNSMANINTFAFYNCISLVDIHIPKSAMYLENNAFLGCDNLTIYCEAESKPSDWHNDWNGNRPVVWGYKSK